MYITHKRMQKCILTDKIKHRFDQKGLLHLKILFMTLFQRKKNDFVSTNIQVYWIE